ncbi:MAG: guanylate kinase [Dehalococcoidia bacterium]|nr:guanylate kinase [Dehalococcoidia bacterium]
MDLLPKEYLARSPLLVVLSGPSGVGKDAVLVRLRALDRPYHFTITATTRPKRASERDGVDYFFYTEEAFTAMKERGEFLESAHVYGHWYGVPRSQVREALSRGRDVFIKIDVQGAATIKSLAPQAVFIFLASPTLEELERRLRQRKTEREVDMERRIKTAQEEMARLPMFDYVVVNDNGRIDHAASTIEAILQAERCRIPPRVARV